MRCAARAIRGEMDDMRYADPDLCPDCRTNLPSGVTICPTCGLPVRHALAVELFATLKRADSLVEQLRSIADSRTALVPPAPHSPLSPSPRVQAPPSAPPAPPAPPPYPSAPAAPHPAPAGRVGVSAIPKILLGLGALCLLVAAIAFLAVSWSILGVGGRTAVLLTLTAAATGGALLLNRFKLRIAGRPRSRHHLALAYRSAGPGMERRSRHLGGVERDCPARRGAGVRGADAARRVGGGGRLVPAGV